MYSCVTITYIFLEKTQYQPWAWLILKLSAKRGVPLNPWNHNPKSTTVVPTCGVTIHRFVSPTVLPGHVADVWQCLALQQEDLPCAQVLYHSVRGVWQCHWWCNAHAWLLLWKKGTCNFRTIGGVHQIDFIQNTLCHEEGKGRALIVCQKEYSPYSVKANCLVALFPSHSHLQSSVLDCLQYANTEGEGLGSRFGHVGWCYVCRRGQTMGSGARS